jgi:hypothetical protein
MRKILGTFLATSLLAICVGTGALAADNQGQGNNLADMQTSSFSTSNYNVQVTTTEVKSTNDSDSGIQQQKTVVIQNRNNVLLKTLVVDCYTDNVDDKAIVNAYTNAQSAIVDHPTNQKATYNYTLMEPDDTYFYEQTATEPNKATMIVTATDTDSANLIPDNYTGSPQTNNLSIQPLQNNNFFASAANFPFMVKPMKMLAASNFNISDGIGGRQTNTNTGSAGSFLNATVTMPTDSQVTRDDTKVRVPYIYGGFEKDSANSNGVGAWSSDMGLMISNAIGPAGNTTNWGWKPFVAIKKKISNTGNPDVDWQTYNKTYVAPNDQVWNRNAYKMGVDVAISWYYNYNSQIRLVTKGIAYAATSGGTPLSDTYLINIMETTAAPGLTSINRWKLNATVVSPDKTGKNYANFKAVNLSGTALTAGYDAPLYDHTSIVRSSNTVTMTVDSSKY